MCGGIRRWSSLPAPRPIFSIWRMIISHLNDLGYQCMAEHIAQAVVANLFVKKKSSERTFALPVAAFQQR